MSESDLLAALGGAAVPFEVAPGVVLHLRPLPMSAAGEYQQYRRANPDDAVGAVCKLVSLSATLPGGAPVSVELAGKMPAAVVEKVAGRIADLNGWGEAAGN